MSGCCWLSAELCEPKNSVSLRTLRAGIFTPISSGFKNLSLESMASAFHPPAVSAKIALNELLVLIPIYGA